MVAAPKWLWHRFDFRGRHYLVNGETGAVHLLDDAGAAAWEVALGQSDGGQSGCMQSDFGQLPSALVSRFGLATATEAWQEVCALAQQASPPKAMAVGQPKAELGAVPKAESEAGAGSGAAPDEPIRIGTPLKALCLLVAMDCNLACRYCFAAPDWHARGSRRMQLEVARRAIDFLLEASGASHFLQIDFFGGEPTLNFDVVREATMYAEAAARRRFQKVNFTLTTNALIWNDEIASFLNEHHFQVILSLDGRPEVHDRLRRRVGDQPSHDVVLPHVSEAVASLVDQNYWVRGTFTHFNPDFAADVAYLVNHGFRQISFEPVVDLPGRPWTLQEDDLPTLLAEYDKLAELYLEQAQKGDPFEFFHFRLASPSGPCVARRISGCGAGYQYLAVTPEGELYPCHQFVGREAYRLGSIFDPDVVQRFSPSPNPKPGHKPDPSHTPGRRPDPNPHPNSGVDRAPNVLSERFRRTHAQSKPECRNCWAKLYCGGGCHANADLLAGDIAATLPFFCALQKKRVELSIALRTELELMGSSGQMVV